MQNNSLEKRIEKDIETHCPGKKAGVVRALVLKYTNDTLLELLAAFDDYSHPLEMTAEYVREQIIKFMDECNE